MKKPAIRKVFALASLFLLASCSAEGKIKTVYCFDSYIELINYDDYDFSNQDVKFLQDLSTLMDNYYGYYYNAGTNLYAINSTNEPLQVDHDLALALSEALEMERITNGYYDPMVGTLSKMWKAGLQYGTTLFEEEIEEAVAAIQDKSTNYYTVDLDTDTVQRFGELEIDLGGIAKGYALRKVKEQFKEMGLTHYLVNAGKSSLIMSEKPDGSPFKIGLSDISSSAYINAKNIAVGVSSNSQQGYTIDGQRYGHIVNPFTGSVIAKHDFAMALGEDPLVCDALSTAMMMMEKDEALDLLANLGYFSLIYDEEGIYGTYSSEVHYH